MKKKKKRIYSKDKTPYFSVNKNIRNPIHFLTYINKKENVWSDYIERMIYGIGISQVSPENCVRYIVDLIPSAQTKKGVLKALMSVEDYNPFVDDIPLSELPENYRNLVVKLQNEIQKRFSDLLKLPVSETSWLYQGIHYKTRFVEGCEENYNRELFFLGYDIVIVRNFGRIVISTNPRLKASAPDFTALFEELNRHENVWYLHGSKKLLMTKKGHVSNIYKKQFNQLLKKFK